MNLRKMNCICLISLFLLSLAVSVSGRSTPRVVVQKLGSMSPYNIMDLVTNTTGTSPAYVIRADILETPGEELGSDLGTSDANLYIRKLGNGMTVPYYVGAGVQLSQFTTQWLAGQNLRFTITHIASGASSLQDIVIPTGSSQVNIQDPVMIIPPYPIIETPAGITASLLPSQFLRISWEPSTGAGGYNLYRSTDGGLSYILLAQPTNTSFDDSVALPVWEPKLFHYKVSAVSGSVESEPSEILSVALDRIASVGNSLIGIPFDTGIMVSDWVYTHNYPIDSVSYWNAAVQQWMTAADLGGFWDGDFLLSGVRVIILSSMTAPYYSIFTSTSSLGGEYPISIVPGYNLIYTPSDLDITDLDMNPDNNSVIELATDIGAGVQSVSLWDAEHHHWKQYCPQHPSFNWGEVLAWQRLFIYSTTAYPNWHVPSTRGGER